MMSCLSGFGVIVRSCFARLVCLRKSQLLGLALLPVAGTVAAGSDLEVFQRDIQPILDEYCYDCHGNGNKKGGVRLDGFESDAALHDHKLWMRAMRNVRSGIMPPADGPTLPPAIGEKVLEWIKRGAFSLDPQKPDPGRVTVRRLNRVDYRNTIRDLLGVDYDTQKEFPADDTGSGFDNIADVLTISPMLLEKYLDAAQVIVSSAVPIKPLAVAEVMVEGRSFKVAPDSLTPVDGSKSDGEQEGAPGPGFDRPAPRIEGKAIDLSYYTPAKITSIHRAPHAGKYELTVDLRAVEKYVDNQFDYNRCRLLFRVDGELLLDREFVRQGSQGFKFTYERDWKAGDHELSFEVIPLEPAREQKRLLRIRVGSVDVRGPMASKYWVVPRNYGRFFPRPVPESAAARRAYARELLENFAGRAFRRPVEKATVEHLVDLAESVYRHPDSTFESGIAQAMVAVLASPRFIFREEATEPVQPGGGYPLIDEYSLASRLSYFLWSSMPDAELFRLAGEHRLRASLPAQVARMLKDPKSAQFVSNFTGQWLQARDITTVQINDFAIYLREHSDPAFEKAQATFRRINAIAEEKRTAGEVAAYAQARKTFFALYQAPKPELTPDLRRAMLRETEMGFAYLLKEDRSLLELIECDYVFLNDKLAEHYGIPGVVGSEMRRVTLPAGSVRGGVLTSGTTLAVTSNPTRTSPVKRGVFILNAILGTPPAPPPPNIPALEDAASPDELKHMTLRETLALHAESSLCSSCHSRMDPLGLALENFNAMGRWRDAELNRPVEPAGELITGETFADIRELKHILATKHRRDYYYCVSEKLLTYALGRGLDYYDTDTVDHLVAQLESSGGRPSALLRAIVESTPFQKCRPVETIHTAGQSPAFPPVPRG